MLRHSPLGHFVVLFVVVYALLAIPWRGWQAAYSDGYRSAANVLFDPFGRAVKNEAGETVKLGRVEFRPADKPNRSSDTDIWTRLRRSPDVGTALHSPRLTGYLPTVELIALALATPVALRRRFLGLVAGLLIVHGFIYVRLWIGLMYYFSTPGTPWQMYGFSAFGWKVLSLCHEVMNVAPVMSFAFPAFVWLGLMFRPADWGGAFGALSPVGALDTNGVAQKATAAPRE